jgi:hypothetical protein
MTPAAVGAASGDFVTPDRVARAREGLRDKGYLLMERAFSREWCAGVTRWMDAHSGEGRTERHYADTELRIWDAQNQSPALQDFWRQSNAFMSQLVGRETEAHTLLAIRNRRLDTAARDLQIGRWHIDSFRQQFKIFLFLVDVAESSGPFEFLPHTQKMPFKLRAALGGKYLGPAGLFAGARSYQSLPDDWVEGLQARGHSSIRVVCPAGTAMVVDTSAIHRASPCFGETRYALTAYF